MWRVSLICVHRICVHMCMECTHIEIRRHIYESVMSYMFAQVYVMHTYQWNTSHSRTSPFIYVCIYSWGHASESDLLNSWMSHVTHINDILRSRRRSYLNFFGSPDLTVFLLDLLSAGDSVYSRENLLENLGTPVKTCLICMGTPVKACLKFWKS